MKKIFATILAASMMLVGANAFAQISVGAGYVNSTSTNKVGDSKSSGDSNGFYLGASYNIGISGGLGLAPGLYYEFLGNSGKGSYWSGSTTEHYVNVPVMVNYGLELMPDCTLFFYAGPTLSCGVASTTQAKVGGDKVSVGAKVNNYDNDNYGRFDVMLGGGVGFNINSFQVKVGYNAGMLDRNASDAVKMHRSEVHLGLGWMF